MGTSDIVVRVAILAVASGLGSALVAGMTAYVVVEVVRSWL